MDSPVDATYIHCDFGLRLLDQASVPGFEEKLHSANRNMAVREVHVVNWPFDANDTIFLATLLIA